MGQDHPDTASCLNNIAILYVSQSRYDEAEPLFRRSLEIREKQLGSYHPDTGTSLGNLAALFQSQGRYDEAEPLLLRSVGICEKLFGRYHSETGMSLFNLANLHISQGRSAETEQLYLRSLEIMEKQLGEDHPNTAIVLDRLAVLYDNQDRFDEAEPYYRRSLEIKEKKFGQNHPNTAGSLNNLAVHYKSQGRYNESEPLYIRSLAIKENQLGENHPDTARSLNNLAVLYESQGRSEEAELLFERSLASSASHWRRMLAYFSERECLEFQLTQVPLEHFGNQDSPGIAANAQLLFKGAVVEAMNARRVAEHQLAKTNEGQELLRQRDLLRSRYQKALLAKGSDADEVKLLQTQLEDLDKMAVDFIGRNEFSRGLLSVGLETVQKSLSEGTRLVEIFRYLHQIDHKNWEFRYATTVIPQSGDPVFLSHGDAESIEADILTYRSGLDGKSSGGPLDAFKKAESALYSRLLTPMEEHVSPGQTVVFSPDGQLHFLPLGMLRATDGKAFAEKYRVRYVSSGRDLVKHSIPRKATGLRAFVLGNPDYRNNAPMVSLAEVSDAAETNADKTTIANNLRSGMGQDSGSIQFRPLPGTAREIGSLTTMLKETGYQVTSVSGKEAKEETVKNSMAGHDVIHLATHGFFLNDLKITSEEGRPLSLSAQDDMLQIGPVQNPMFRSGLALAGAQSTFNLWKSGQVPPPAKDGVLLAAELTYIDLRGTDLVVLSACETASGESLDGEGVIGLRRALNAAGATNVIMTLWPIDDTATVEVMEVFYEKYLSGVPASKALADTQLELLPRWIELHGEVKALSRLAPFICTSLGPVE